MKKCAKLKKGGKPCKAYAQSNSDYCFTHDPTRAGDRRRARQVGGYNRRQIVPGEFPTNCDLATIEGLIKFGVAQIQETWKLGNSIGRARALSQMTHVQERLIELQYIHMRNDKIEQEDRKRELRRKIDAVVFSDDYDPNEDATEEELIKTYKELIEEPEELPESSKDKEGGAENHVVASVDGSADSELTLS